MRTITIDQNAKLLNENALSQVKGGTSDIPDIDLDTGCCIIQFSCNHKGKSESKDTLKFL